jgi:hypothetical protein
MPWKTPNNYVRGEYPAWILLDERSFREPHAYDPSAGRTNSGGGGRVGSACFVGGVRIGCRGDGASVVSGGNTAGKLLVLEKADDADSGRGTTGECLVGE